MRIIEQLRQAACWQEFLTYKKEECMLPEDKWQDLECFVEQQEYEPFVERMEKNRGFSIPVKRQISKIESGKKRTIYVYSREENYVLKMLTYLLIRKYDYLFAPNLYSFRAKKGVENAIRVVSRYPGIDKLYGYKVDIRNYFNSVSVEMLMPMLEEILAEDIEIFQFLKTLLEDRRVYVENQVVVEEKGIMAGCPVAAFLANVYLRSLDEFFSKHGILYGRYSDDIIFFADCAAKREDYIGVMKQELSRLSLTVNPEKECFYEPHEKWEFLGISYQDGIVDISSISKKKLKDKMRRKASALLRWKRQKGIANEFAVRAFIKAFNRRLYDNPRDSEMTWTRWFFPMINTTKSLREIDRYMQDCIRYIATEKRTKRRYDFRYGDMKRLGYRSLVNEYYNIKEATAMVKKSKV